MRLFVVISLFGLISCTTQPKNTAPVVSATTEAMDMRPECIQKRAAFDIGSGETRLNVSKVNICSFKIIATELELSEKVPYKETMTGGKRYISQPTMQQGFKVLQNMKKEAEKFKPDAYLGVATAVFREARNGKTFMDEVNKSLKINARIISQKEEATIGYYAALSNAQLDPRPVAVWDIGGSSMQIIGKKADGQFAIYEGKLASVSFKDRVLAEIKNKKQGSPNPLTAEEMAKSIALAETFATQDVNADIKDLAKQKDVRMIGIGSVHYYSILKQSRLKGGNVVSKLDVAATTKELTDKDNSYFEDQKYVDTTITNVALVEGYMKALHINELEILKVNLAHGVLVHPSLWQ